MKYNKLSAIALLAAFAITQGASASMMPANYTENSAVFCNDLAQTGPTDWSVYLEEGLKIHHKGGMDSASLDSLVSLQSDDAQAVLMKFKAFVSQANTAAQTECMKSGADSAKIRSLYMASINSGKNMLVNKYNPNLMTDFIRDYKEAVC